MARDLLLARIRQAAALTAREYRGLTQVQLRHPPSAGAAADRFAAATEPWTCTTEVAPRPSERHSLIVRFPLAALNRIEATHDPLEKVRTTASASVRTLMLPAGLPFRVQEDEN
jgi:hypothetical protein